MKISRVGVAALLVLGVHACAALAPAQSEPPYVVYHKRGSYADVLEDVRQAIIGRGMVIGAVSHVAEMLDRTGRDLGSGKTIYQDGEVLLFCSAVLSRKAMEEDARNIVFCPYGIAVWTEVGRPGEVAVGYRRADPRSTSSAIFRDIEKLLADIVREAIGG